MDAVLRGKALNTLNEIKRLAITAFDTHDDLPDDVYEALRDIIVKADCLQDEINR